MLLTVAPSITSPAPTGSPASLAAEVAAGHAIDSFGADLYQRLQAGKGGTGNLFFSPLSVSTALAMVYAGARGETAAQLAKALHLSGDPTSIADQFGTLLADLKSAGGGDYKLNVADAVWSQQGMPLLADFLHTMQTAYAGDLNTIDFKSAPEDARKAINDWVATQTNDKIRDLFPGGSITQATRLALANAVYFNGQWATAFDAQATKDAHFTLLSGAVEQVSTMHSTADYRYMQRDGYQVVELPYAGGRLAMDVLLPSAGSGSDGLDIGRLPSDLNSWFDGLSTNLVSVSLPKFKLDTQFDLGRQLKSLGIVDAFNANADFSGMSDTEQFRISDVVHKAFIDVDESGTEAAAATGVAMIALADAYNSTPPVPIQFNVDHPFQFVIRDTLSGSVLFMGQETNPLQSAGDSSADGIDQHRGSSELVGPPTLNVPQSGVFHPAAPAKPPAAMPLGAVTAPSDPTLALRATATAQPWLPSSATSTPALLPVPAIPCQTPLDPRAIAYLLPQWTDFEAIGPFAESWAGHDADAAGPLDTFESFGWHPSRFI